MTTISRLGFVPNKQKTMTSDILQTTEEITIVIPVKDNQQGIDTFLTEFFATHSPDIYPREIIIVDNNSKPDIQINQKGFPIPVRLLKCKKIGPASARNCGARNAKTDWILFVDSDCIPTSTLLTGYIKVQNGSLGYAVNIKANRQDVISRYY